MAGPGDTPAQAAHPYAGTYSAVARCPRTGAFGTAVATATVAVGALVPWIRPGIGAACTQAWTNPHLARAALDRLAAGLPAGRALAETCAEDPAAALRQLGLVGREGPGAAWTGADCTPWAGHLAGPDFAVQGNMLTGPELLPAMAEALAADAPLEARLMRALEAAQAVGGDLRGRQSAALRVMEAGPQARLDLRVDEHPDPVAELRRLFDRLQVPPAPRLL